MYQHLREDSSQNEKLADDAGGSRTRTAPSTSTSTVVSEPGLDQQDSSLPGSTTKPRPHQHVPVAKGLTPETPGASASSTPTTTTTDNVQQSAGLIAEHDSQTSDAVVPSADEDWEDILQNARELVDGHPMMVMMGVLQTIGVEAYVANKFAAPLSREEARIHQLRDRMQHRRDVVASITRKQPSFAEINGRGSIMDMAPGAKRDLNIEGLHALDIRTKKPNGRHWDFNKASDRQEVRRLVEDLKLTWLIGSPPCTAFSQLQNLNFRKHAAGERPADSSRRTTAPSLCG